MHDTLSKGIVHLFKDVYNETRKTVELEDDIKYIFWAVEFVIM